MNMAVNTNRSDDEQLEDMIQRKGKTAPRVTPADIENAIASEHYFTASDGVVGVLAIGDAAGKKPGDRVAVSIAEDIPVSLDLLTFCVLILRNGFTVTGESACASPENFDAEIGRKIARQNAVSKIWPLEGYLLKQKLHDGEGF
ncbi:hypothetical protein LL999_23050 [Burkholderia ambifaria]|uniref:Gp49 family protein n=1 Tax=Burkholderia ambifaria TaxID=152480 RepID=UPI001E597244|nr:Gp49 family protein [Burkholderia ambifaria]UEP23126.1 hypothetical protein LL999_23050 [Burkholderia ambifaria]